MCNNGREIALFHGLNYNEGKGSVMLVLLVIQNKNGICPWDSTFERFAGWV